MTDINTAPADALTQGEVDELLVLRATVDGYLPEDTTLPRAQLVKLCAVYDEPVADWPIRLQRAVPGGAKSGDYVAGLLDSRPLQYIPGYTTLMTYAELPASVKVWPTRDMAQKFVDYENSVKLPYWKIELF